MNKNLKSNKYFIMMRGNPGAGKSTFSKAIARSLSAVIIENDIIKNQLKKLLKHEYVSKSSYLISYELLSQNINANLNVIFDICATDLETYTKCKKLAGKKHKLIACECYCSDLEMLRKRLKKRTYPWQENSFDRVYKNLKKMDIIPAHHLIKIDTSKPLNSNVKKFLEFVKDIGNK